MDPFNPKEDFMEFQRRQPPRNPPTPPPSQNRPQPGSGPNFSTGPFPGPGSNPGPGFGPGPGSNPGPGFGPGPGGPPGSAPRTAPPNFTPSRQMTPFRVDPSSIRNCLGRFTYVWLNNGDEFWMFPIQVGRNSVSGFRWNRSFGWSFFGLSLNRIDAFMCV